MGYPSLHKQFKERTGYELDLNDPKSFNEKVCWKKINDRNPLLPIVADKYRVREYLKDILGTEEAEQILIPLLYVTNKAETIPFDDLPEEYIIKTNHGSGTNIIIEKDKPVDRQQIIIQCKEWLNQPYGLFKHEWAYQKIERKIVIEKLIRDDNKKLPSDYKFHLFHGKCYLIDVFLGRYHGTKRSLFDSNWNYIDVGWKVRKWNKGGSFQKPDNLENMIKFAEVLASPFDYIRVDLYSVNGRIYFGELTNYPSSGTGEFDPRSFDYELGSKWKLQPKYWENIKHEDTNNQPAYF